MMIVQVHCVDTRGGLVPDARCNILSRPDSEAYCSAGPCVTNTWLVSQWDVVRMQSQTVFTIFTFSLLVSGVCGALFFFVLRRIFNLLLFESLFNKQI